MPVDKKQASDTEELRRRNRELTVLNAFAQALNREVDLDRALHTALAQVTELLDLQTGWIWLFRPDGNRSYMAAAQDLPPALANEPRRMMGSCLCLDTYRKGDLKGAANVNVLLCSRLESLVDGTNGLAYHASIPLYAHGKKLGVLNVASRDWRELSPEDLRLLYTVGDLLSISIERARLFERTTRLAAVEERNRIAREIHDTLAQGLTGIALQLEMADALLEGQDAESERARDAVRQALDLTHANLEEARRSVLDLRAAPLEDRTLAEALAELAEERSAKGHFQVKVEIKGASGPLPVRIETGLYRIAQEALTNVSRHAGAHNVMLQMSTLTNSIRLTIEDDGKGFNPSRVPQGRFGLIGMNERARLLGGTLHAESSPGKGTRISVTVPLEPPAGTKS
jgi:two-component system NarL family sensor kinase